MTFVLTCLPTGRQNEKAKIEKDWVCIIFSHQCIDLQFLLNKDPFPTDYAIIAPDFMILPVSLFRWQVELLVVELEGLTRNVLNEEEKLNSIFQLAELDTIRRRIFELGKIHVNLRRKWLFERELADTLLQYFSIIERQHAMEEVRPKYSETLRRRVQTDDHLCKSLEYDLDSIPLKIESQRKVVCKP